VGKEASSSFLKKRTKKLLFVSGGASGKGEARQKRATDKSFLVLFFKKELVLLHLALPHLKVLTN